MAIDLTWSKILRNVILQCRRLVYLSGLFWVGVVRFSIHLYHP